MDSGEASNNKEEAAILDLKFDCIKLEGATFWQVQLAWRTKESS